MEPIRHIRCVHISLKWNILGVKYWRRWYKWLYPPPKTLEGMIPPVSLGFRPCTLSISTSTCRWYALMLTVTLSVYIFIESFYVWKERSRYLLRVTWWRLQHVSALHVDSVNGVSEETQYVIQKTTHLMGRGVYYLTSTHAWVVRVGKMLALHQHGREDCTMLAHHRYNRQHRAICSMESMVSWLDSTCFAEANSRIIMVMHALV